MGESTESIDADPAVATPPPDPNAPREAPARAATIYDVATAAGVSHQTVSRFLKGFEGIRPETRAKVVKALDELGYRPNLTARSLKSGRSHRIGALTHEISQYGPSRIAEGASAAAREAGYVLDLVSLDAHNPRAIEESLELITQHNLAGILALASTDEMKRAFETTAFRVPAFIAAESDILTDAEPAGSTGAGMPALIGHLALLGHRDVVHIAGPQTWSAARNRLRAYTAAIEHAGLRSRAVLRGDWSAKSGYDAIAALEELPEATAYVAANDQMALGAMLALKQRGLHIPDDVSVAGVDDTPEAAYFDPPLTTLRLDFEAQGRAAVRALLSRIEPDVTEPSPPASPQLMVRESTGPANQS
ncbi:LacI family DNA-binding transcriptional regulator [Agromyces sp. SYSU T00266]|uniref:LacI family DNA-binding transcriptional regulator n=1 Tax=Agromyces zhanjiangensis TaxID=3158562 RepID=UPI003397BAA0